MPPLRLVGAGSAPNRSALRVARRVVPAREEHTREVTRENLAAASMSVSDARWAFAVRVASSIEGKRAGILRPDVRQRLVQQAAHLGLRPFDANLVIAIIQDAARTGAPLSPEAAERLKLVRNPAETRARQGALSWRGLLASSAIAILLVWLAIRWLVG